MMEGYCNLYKNNGKIGDVLKRTKRKNFYLAEGNKMIHTRFLLSYTGFIRRYSIPMIENKECKLLAVISLVVTLAGSGIINSALASYAKANVNCKDLALTLITLDQLVSVTTADDIAENEHQLNEKNIQPDLYANLIDDHLAKLLEQVKDDCSNSIDRSMKHALDEIDFELPF